jgi:hypothetical protein
LKTLKLALICFALAFLCLAGLVWSACATTYYVDTASSGGDGTTTATSGAHAAFATIAAVNGASFNAGDSVLFKCGDTWREQLTVPNSGSSGAGNAITFGTYGTAATPIISGSNVISSFTSESVTAGANLITNPNDFTGAGFPNWDAATRATVLGNTTDVLAPDGTNTSAKVSDTTDNNTHLMDEWVGLTVGQTYTVSVYVRPPKKYSTDYTSIDPWIQLAVQHLDSGFGQVGVLHSANVNSLSGAIGSYSTGISNLTVTKAGYDWLRVSFTFTVPATTVYNIVQIYLASQNGTVSYAGVPSIFPVHCYLWGCKVENASAPTPMATYTAYYKASISTEPQVAFQNGSRLEKSGDKSLYKGMFWFDSVNSRLYVRATGDDSPAGYTIEAGQRDYAITANGKNYLSFTGITATSANVDGVYLTGACTNHTYTSCAFNNNAQMGLATDQAATTNALDLEYCTGSRNGSHGVYFRNVTNSKIAHGTWYRNGWTKGIPTGPVELQWSSGIKIIHPSSTGNVFEYNESSYNGVRDNGDITAARLSGAGMWFDLVGTGNIQRYNYVHHNAGIGVEIEKNQGSQIIYNIIANGYEVGILAESSDGLDINSVNTIASVITANLHIWNNTLYNNRTNLMMNGCYLLNGKYVQGNLIKNNIFFTNTSGVNAFFVYGGENDGTYGSGNAYTYNDFGPQATNFIEWGLNTYKSTYATWETAYGGTTHSVQSDPLFVSTATPDFHLTSTSPCINAGVGVGLTENIPDMGAIPYAGRGSFLGF